MFEKAVLFPGENAISAAELREVARSRSNGRITVIAVDATWRNAVRLKQSYPSGLIQVKLDATSPIIRNQTQSLLYPVSTLVPFKERFPMKACHVILSPVSSTDPILVDSG